MMIPRGLDNHDRDKCGQGHRAGNSTSAGQRGAPVVVNDAFCSGALDETVAVLCSKGASADTGSVL